MGGYAIISIICISVIIFLEEKHKMYIKKKNEEIQSEIDEIESQ